MKKDLKVDSFLLELRAWVESHKVRCAESLMQVDSIQEALPDLAEIVCEHVGYYEEED